MKFKRNHFYELMQLEGKKITLRREFLLKGWKRVQFYYLITGPTYFLKKKSMMYHAFPKGIRRLDIVDSLWHYQLTLSLTLQLKRPESV